MENEIYENIQKKISSGKYDDVFHLLNNLGLEVDKLDFIKTVKKQHGKGVVKYGVSLKDCDCYKYEWKDMALEELADLFQYIEKSKMIE